MLQKINGQWSSRANSRTLITPSRVVGQIEYWIGIAGDHRWLSACVDNKLNAGRQTQKILRASDIPVHERDSMFLQSRYVGFAAAAYQICPWQNVVPCSRKNKASVEPRNPQPPVIRIFKLSILPSVSGIPELLRCHAVPNPARATAVSGSGTQTMRR